MQIGWAGVIGHMMSYSIINCSSVRMTSTINGAQKRGGGGGRGLYTGYFIIKENCL